jgi:hypothetical protein
MCHTTAFASPRHCLLNGGSHIAAYICIVSHIRPNVPPSSVEPQCWQGSSCSHCRVRARRAWSQYFTTVVRQFPNSTREWQSAKSEFLSAGVTKFVTVGDVIRFVSIPALFTVTLHELVQHCSTGGISSAIALESVEVVRSFYWGVVAFGGGDALVSIPVHVNAYSQLYSTAHAHENSCVRYR